MYRKFYGFKERPFEITPDPKFVYLSEIHQEALAHLQYAVREGKGFSVITGEAGTGKTTLVHMLLSKLDGYVRTSYIFNPILDRADFLNYICDDLGIESDGMKSRGQSLTALHNFLLDCFARDEKVFLIIDEAQSLEPGLLQEVRLLTNLETSKNKLLHVILLGQPELNQILAEPRFRPLKQRITVRYHLRPLRLKETKAIHPVPAQEGRIEKPFHLRQWRHQGDLPLFKRHPAPHQHRLRQCPAHGIFSGGEPDRENNHPGYRSGIWRGRKSKGERRSLLPFSS